MDFKVLEVKNLAQLKQSLKKGRTFRILHHQKSERIGLLCVVNKVQTNAIYSVIKDRPEHPYSTCNGGKGVRLQFDKAAHYEFGTTINWYAKPVGSPDNELIMKFQILLDFTEANAPAYKAAATNIK